MCVFIWILLNYGIVANQKRNIYIERKTGREWTASIFSLTLGSRARIMNDGGSGSRSGGGGGDNGDGNGNRAIIVRF